MLWHYSCIWVRVAVCHAVSEILHQTGKSLSLTLFLFDTGSAGPFGSFLWVWCTFAPLHDARQCQVFQKQKVPVPLRRCSPAVSPGLSLKGERVAPRHWQMGQEVLWGDRAWMQLQNQQRTKGQSFLRSHQGTCTGSKCPRKWAPKQ